MFFFSMQRGASLQPCPRYVLWTGLWLLGLGASGWSLLIVIGAGSGIPEPIDIRDAFPWFFWIDL